MSRSLLLLSSLLAACSPALELVGDPEPADALEGKYDLVDFAPGSTVEVCHVTSGLNLRSSPSTNGKVLRVLEPGTRATVLAQSGKWFELDALGDRGWSHGQYLCAVSAPSPDAGPTPPPPPAPDGGGAESGCLVLDQGWVIAREASESACLAAIGAKESQYQSFLETGDYRIAPRSSYSLWQRSAMIVFFEVNRQRIQARSNLRIEDYYASRLPAAAQPQARSSWQLVEQALSTLPDESGVARALPSSLYFMPTSDVPEHERVLFDTPAETRGFGAGSVLAGSYSEEQLYDRLRSLAHAFRIPQNGMIVVVQDLVDGAPHAKFGQYWDTFFYLHREGQRKRVVEVVGNLRTSGASSGPYYTMSEFGLFKDFADVHIYNSDRTSVTALRGARSWEVSSSGSLSSTGRKSYNMHPGGRKDARGSAGCATIPNRASSGRSRDYKIFMTTIHSYAFHSNKLLGDSYSSSDAAVAAQIDLNQVFIRKIKVY
jgi:hypothetical protein